MFDNFFNKLSKGITLTEADKAIFRQHIIIKKLRKRQYLLQEGEVCKYVAFVSKGMLRAFLVDSKNNEHIIQFAPEGWFISDLSSFITEDQSTLNIDALEDSELILISKAAHVYLETAVPKKKRINTECSIGSNRESTDSEITGRRIGVIEIRKIFISVHHLK